MEETGKRPRNGTARGASAPEARAPMSGTSPSPLDIVRTRSLSSLVAQEIERMILAGSLAAGERLNEAALATSLGAHLADIAALTGLACARLAETGTAAQLAALRAMVKRMEAAWRADEAACYYAGNLDFHAALLEFGGGPRARRLYAELGNELHLYRRRALVQPENMRESNAEHATILRAIAARDVVAARAAGEIHIAGGKRRFQSTGAPPAPAASTKTPRQAVPKGENHDTDHKDRPSRPADRRLGARRGAARPR